MKQAGRVVIRWVAHVSLGRQWRLASAFIGGATQLAKALGTAALSPPLSALQVSHGRFIFALVFLFGVFSGATRALFGWR